jgi:methionyl-tRNA formyltransferase
MRVIFFGTPQFAVPTLQALVAHPDFDVVAVVTQPDKRRGRGNELSPSPVKVAADALPIWQPQRIKKDPATLAALRAYQADCFVVVAYGQILSQEILDMPRYGCVNGHGSLLPQYRGAAPIQWCLYHGAAVTGMTTMLMDIGMDTGAMLLKSQRPIGLLDNAHELALDLAEQCATLMLETLPQLAAGTIVPIPQDESQATDAALIQKADYELDWTKPAIDLHNQVRGFYPNCTTEFRGNPLKIIATVPLLPELADRLPREYADLTALSPTFSPSPVEPGQVAAIDKKFGVLVQTVAGLLLLREVQPAGKKAQSGVDFANGLRIEVGERFGALSIPIR